MDTQTRDQDLEAQEDFELWEKELGQNTPRTTTKDGEKVSDLEFEKNSSEKAKISLPETIIVLTASVLADITDLIPFFGLVFGLFVSAAIILWSTLRGAHGRFFVKKLVIKLFGFTADATLGFGILPIRTVTMVIVIWLNNHVEGKNIARLAKILG